MFNYLQMRHNGNSSIAEIQIAHSTSFIDQRLSE